MKRNLIVFLVTIVTAALGVMLPFLAKPLAFLPTLFMVTQLLFCFLSTLDPSTPLPASSLKPLPRFLALKMLMVPLLCWAAVRLVFPQYALGALLVSGSAMGVMSPFFAFLAGADALFIIGGVIVSSLLMPLTLPTLAAVALLADGLSVSGLMQSCLGTAAYLGGCMAVPFLAAKILWATQQRVAQGILAQRYWLTLLCMGGTNVIVFGRFSGPLLANPGMVLTTLGIGIFLCALLLFIGFIMARKLPREQAMAKIIGFSCVNNVLVVIISAEFFSLKEMLVATMFGLPMLGLGIPYHWLNGYLQKNRSA